MKALILGALACGAAGLQRVAARTLGPGAASGARRARARARHLAARVPRSHARARTAPRLARAPVSAAAELTAAVARPPLPAPHLSQSAASARACAP